MKPIQVAGQRYDTGNPQELLRTVNALLCMNLIRYDGLISKQGKKCLTTWLGMKL